MRVLACITFLTSFFIVFAYISKSLKNDLHDNTSVFDTSVRNVKTDGSDNIFWFVQVTDIHVSRFYGHTRAPDLQKFCETHLSIIKPDLVIASGDLTDAKFRDLKGSKQFKDEWQTYHQTITKCQQYVNTWLDLRGNHDAFDTPDHDHVDNLFRQYSSQGGDNPTSYVYHHKKNFGKYSFVGVDATPNPGPKRPFNFFGYVKQDGELLVNQILNESRTSNMTIAFGHYPTSLIATQSGNSMRYILRNVTAYLCGHLHTLAGLVPRMYARHKTGMLELELGDWKDQRLYRILAVDHDMLSIYDAVVNKWPIVMVTNPKDASLQAPLHEPLYAMNKSTHIRMLIFSDGTVNNVEVYVDSVHLGKATHIEGPIYTRPWDPTKLSGGIHTLKIVVNDIIYGRHVTEHQFSLDWTSPLLPFRGRFILMMDITTLVQAVYFLCVCVYVGVLLLLRNCNSIKPHLFTTRRGLLGFILSFYNNWLYRLWLVTRVSRLYYVIVLFVVYISCGPWLIGEIMEGHTGVIFVWGMFVHGSYLPVCLTYIYGLFQVITFNIPLSLYLGYYLHFYQSRGTIQHSLCHLGRHIYFPFLALLIFQAYMAASEFPAAYGLRAMFLGPVRTGSLVIALYLFYVVRKTNTGALVCRHEQ